MVRTEVRSTHGDTVKVASFLQRKENAYDWHN
jgi:hypothetical protein